MYQSFKVITPPAVEPITTAQAKAQMRVDISDDDTLIERLIKAARVFVETNTRRGLIEQIVEIQLDEFPSDGALPLHVIAPLISVESVSYYDADDTDQTLASSSYYVDDVREPGAIYLAAGEFWPTTTARPDAVRVLVKIGYGATADTVPDDLVHAMFMLVAHWYENRETVVVGVTPAEVPFAVNALMGPYLRPECF